MNKINKNIIFVLLIVVIALGAFLLNRGNESQKITFGLISGLSGDYAVVGEAFTKGVELAQAEWNKENLGRQIEIIIEDDGFDAKKGLSAYKKLTEIDKIDGLINMTTVTIDVIYDSVLKSGLPVALGFEQSLEAKKDNVVQLWPGTIPAEAELGSYVREKGYKNILIVIDKESAVFERFASGFRSGYSLPVQEIRIGKDIGDIKSSALKILSSKPDAIVFIATPTIGALLVKELTTLSSEKYQFVFDANIQTGFSDYKKILGDTNKLNGSILYTVPSIYRQDFNNAFRNKFGQEPTIGSETGYNTFLLLAKSYDNNKAKWVENMQKASFIGADGQIKFDENGVRIPELKIGIIENGGLPN